MGRRQWSRMKSCSAGEILAGRPPLPRAGRSEDTSRRSAVNARSRQSMPPMNAEVITRAQALLRGASLGRELSLVEPAELVEAGRLGWHLVVAHARDAREPQRESRRIGRALLDLVIGHFDDDLGPHAHRVPI